MAKKSLNDSLEISSLSDDMQKALSSVVEKHDKLNNYLEKEYDTLTQISDQYATLSETFNSINMQQEKYIEGLSDTENKQEDILKGLEKYAKLKDELLKMRKDEADVLSGASKIQAKLNDEYRKHYNLAEEFRKSNLTMFAPQAVQPFIKMLENANSKFNKFSASYQLRQVELENRKKKLLEENKRDEYAALEWAESSTKKVFDTIEGTLKTLWETGSFIFSKLFGHLKKIFNMLLDMGKKFMDFFLKIPDTLLTITKSAFAFQKVTMEYIQNLSQSIIAIPLNILEKAQELGYEIKKEMAEFAQAYENVQKDFKGGSFIGKGLQSIHNNLISARKEFMNVNTEAVHLFGRGIQGINKALGESSEIVKSLGVFSSIFAKQIIKNKDNLFYYYKMKQTFNLADDDMQYLARQATVTGKSIATVYDQIEKSITGAADIHHQDAKQMSRDYFDMRKNVIDFGHISNRELGNIVARTRQMGVEVKEAAGMFQKLQTFEDAANMASQLSQGFNMVVDSMALLKAESPDQVLQMLRDSMFATGRSFNQLNRFEKSLLQQQTGLSGEAMQALFEYQNLGKSYEQIMQEMEANDPTKLQLKSMQDLRDTVVEMKEVMPKFQNSFEAFFSGLKDNTLLSSKLRNDLSAISFSFDDLYQAGLSSSMKAFVPVLTTISSLINNIKTTLTDSKFVSSMTKIAISIANITNSLFSTSTNISSDISTLISEIQPLFENLFDIGFGIIKTGLEIFIKSLPSILALISTQVISFFGPSGFFITKLIPTLKTTASSLINVISNPTFQKTIIDSFKTIFSFSSEFIKLGADIAKNLVQGIISDLQKGTTGSVILTEFTGLINSIFDMFIGKTSISNTRRSGGLIKQILGFDPVTGNLNLGSSNSIFKAIYNTLFPIMTDIVHELSFVFVDLTNYLSDTIADFAKTGFNDLFIDTSWNKIFNNIANAFSTILSGNFLDNLMKAAINLLDYIQKNTGRNFKDDIIAIIGKISGFYFDFYVSIYKNFLSEFVKENMGKITFVLSSFVGYFVLKAHLAGTIIANAFMNAGDVVASKIATAAAVSNPPGNIPGSVGKSKKGFSGATTMQKFGSGAAIAAPILMSLAAGGGYGSGIGGALGGIAGGALGSFLGPVGMMIGSSLGSSLGSWAGSYFDDGFISKDGKITKIHDNDNVLAFKEDGPVLNSGNRVSELINKNRPSIDMTALTNDMSIKMKDAVQAAMIEGFKSQNQTIEVKLNGEKVGEGLLASGLTNMMSNANKTKGNPTINPNSIIYRDGQIPSSGYINS